MHRCVANTPTTVNLIPELLVAWQKPYELQTQDHIQRETTWIDHQAKRQSMMPSIRTCHRDLWSGRVGVCQQLVGTRGIRVI